MAAWLGMVALLVVSTLSQDCTIPEVSNAHDEGVCGAGSLGAGETCEPRCAEGFEARGKQRCYCRRSLLLLQAESSCLQLLCSRWHTVHSA